MTTSYLLANSVFVETNLPLDRLSLTTLEQAFFQVQQRLSSFARDPEFRQKMALTFGLDADVSAVQAGWLSGDYDIPVIGIRAGEELNGALGAYAAATNTIYLSREFLASSSIEEVGLCCWKKWVMRSTPELIELTLGAMRGLYFRP